MNGRPYGMGAGGESGGNKTIIINFR